MIQVSLRFFLTKQTGVIALNTIGGAVLNILVQQHLQTEMLKFLLK